MKRFLKLTIGLMCIPFLLGCDSDDGAGDDDLITGGSFVRLSITGPSLNGTFAINADGDDPGILITGIGIPMDTGQELMLSYYDYDQVLAFGLRIPGRMGETEVLENNLHGFDVAFANKDLSLHELTTSVSITELDVDGFLLNRVKGTITGMVQFTHREPGGEEFKEPHTMDGVFQYNGKVDTRD